MGPWKLLSALSILSAACTDVSLSQRHGRVMSDRTGHRLPVTHSPRDPRPLPLVPSVYVVSVTPHNLHAGDSVTVKPLHMRGTNDLSSRGEVRETALDIEAAFNRCGIGDQGNQRVNTEPDLTQMKIYKTCFYSGSAKDPSILSLAQSGNVAILEKTLKTHKHISQLEFDLRTLDPEGLVFYGDTEGSVNWFILGLRNGRPEIQLSNQYCQTAVSSGDVLNDGRWRTITVQSDRRNIKLLVDGKPSLIITVLPNAGLEGNLIDMRITMGHLLINESSLLIPLKDRLDACITNWDWLQQNTSLLAKEVASNPDIQCPTSIMPGAFFPGMGMATFKSSSFQNDSESQEDWSLRFEALIRPSKHSGLVLAILSQTYTPLLQLDFVLNNRQEQFRLKLRGSTLVQLPGPRRLCEGQRVALSLSASEVSLQVGSQRRSRPVTQDTIATLRTAWFDREALLFLGGLPDLDTLDYDWFYFEGCMQELRVQGVSVDLNQAFFVHEAISTHSCPAVKFSQLPGL